MNAINGYDFEDLTLGMHASFTKTLTQQDIVLFADASGDRNPVHLDEGFAQQTPFQGCIVHGMLTASLISAAVAGHMPGAGTVLLSQSLRYKAPVRPGDTVRATVTVKELLHDKRWVNLSTVCEVAGRVVVEGDALVMPTSKVPRQIHSQGAS
jgi:3-hydroxybutyryl-CoA dehydratase